MPMALPPVNAKLDRFPGLGNAANDPYRTSAHRLEVVPPRGIEPLTFSLQVSCSAGSELWRRRRRYCGADGAV